MSYVMYVGWDWADKQHDLMERDAGGWEKRKKAISGRPDAVHEWAQETLVRAGGGRIAVCIEGLPAVVHALSAYPHIVLFPVNPKSVAKFREAFAPSGKKDDPIDADTLLEMVEKHHDKLHALEPSDPATRSLHILTEFRRKIVGELVRETHRLRANLKCYFPQALEVLTELDSPLACDFLTRWSSLEELRRARPETVSKFYREHNSRSNDLIKQRLAAIAAAVPLTSDEALNQCGRIETQVLVELIRSLVAARAKVDREIAKVYESHAERDLIDSLPGAGPVLSARLCALLGTDRSRYATREEIQQATGVAPITKRTGGSKGRISVHRRWSRPKFAHQTVIEWTAQTVKTSGWAKAAYEKQRASGASHYEALRALAFKWLRILHHCWTHNVKYSEETHLSELKKRRSPTIGYLAA